jgi:hypothetical protein
VEEISKKVSIARRRLMINQFLQIMAWAMFLGFLVIAIGVAVPKIWHLPSLHSLEAAQFWNAAWIVGGSVLTLLLAAGIAIMKRQSMAEVAVEVDHRFNLKQRLSSTLTMSANQRQTDAGEALTADATHQAEVIDVGEQFPIQPRWSMVLPLAPLMLLGLLVTIPNATSPRPILAPESLTPASETSEIKSAVEQLKKTIEKNELTKGLSDVNVDFGNLQKTLDNAKGEKKEIARKKALIKLNNIKQQIADRQSKLGSTKDFKAALNKLKNIGQGPAKKLAEAMQKGDLKAAEKAIQDLADKLKSGNLSKTDKKQLAKDLQDMAQQFKDIAKAQQQKKQQLKKQIEKSIQQGNLDNAAKLQEKLEQLEKQDRQKKKMQDLADQLQKCARCMNPGQAKNGNHGQPQNAEAQNSASLDAESQLQQAGDTLEDLAKQIRQMQQEMDQLQDMEDLQDAIKQCKNGMCPGRKPNDKPFRGMGSGRGIGDRPQQSEPTGNYKSRVRGKLQKGQMIVTGKADGENLTGRTTSEARKIVEATMNSQTDPLENQVLPRSQREHAKQYFESLREGL